jgi:hypothetical protein
MIMTTETVSSTSPDCLIFKGNSSFADYTIRLHFCELGLKKLSQLSRRNPHASLHGFARIDELSNSVSGSFTRPEWFWMEVEKEQSAFGTSTLSLLGTALQRYLQGWIECHGTPAPLTGYVVLLGSTIHLIVECESGTTKTYKDMSAECLVFFNGPGSGLSKFHQ